MIKVLLFVWQLPQNILGLILLIVQCVGGRIERTLTFFGSGRKWLQVNMAYCTGFHGGISLGMFIILNVEYTSYAGDTERHEYGHCLQSVMLGPLYLLVIGIPSILHAWWWNSKRGVSYYDFWTERWADRLGGVERYFRQTQ